MKIIINLKLKYKIMNLNFQKVETMNSKHKFRIIILKLIQNFKIIINLTLRFKIII